MPSVALNDWSEMRAYVVDDDDDFRDSVITLLDASGWAAQAFRTAGDFLSIANSLEPGLMLLDLHLEHSSGLDLLESGSIDLDRFGVVMMTGAGDIQTAVRSIQAGALDFVEKPFEAGSVLRKLGQINAGFQISLQAKTRMLDARHRIDKLSNREREVLEHLLCGASNKLIARDLDLSPRTVEMHRARMLQKLGAKSTAEALALARQAGLATNAELPAPE